MSRRKKKSEVKAYSFKANRYLPPEVRRVGAEVVGRAVESAIASDGTVDKKLLIESARPDEAPLHPCFEWSDPKAADLYRQFQARNIVNAVTVKIEGINVAAFPTVSIKVHSSDAGESSPPRRENIRVEAMLDDAELRQQKINEVLAKLIRLRQEYQSFNELAVVWRAIEEAQGAVVAG